MLIKNFYPTPPALIRRMRSKIKGEPYKILEPSAGQGDIITAIRDADYRGTVDIAAIEKDEKLQAVLRDKDIKVIDGDFLTYAGHDKFDLIIGNPPFENGDLHLLKAIEIMYRGEIVFLLNAETLKNPYSKTRQALAAKLEDLNAEVEYIENAFIGAERKTGVEVALVYINIERKAEEDLFDGAADTVTPECSEVEDRHELSTGKTIAELVAEYNRVVNTGVEAIVNYYRHYKIIGKYVGLNQKADENADMKDSDHLTTLLQSTINEMLQTVRVDFWRSTLGLSAVQKRLTVKKQDEFEMQLAKRSDMDFTESNIRQFILNIIGSYEQTLTEAVMDVFDKFTVRHCFSDGLYDKNIHMFNGWKTNNAFKVGKKVIIPMYGSHGAAFRGFRGWDLNWGAERQLDDIDKVMNYFDGMSSYVSIAEALKVAFKEEKTRKIKSTYFTITVYKKGTMHLTFNSADILRRFNVAACRGKKWLPHDYGSRSYSDISNEERGVVDSFEGEKSYKTNLNRAIFAKKNLGILSENNA